MAEKSYEEKYTHPKLRKEIKQEIQASDKGGKPGQWSARKSQLLTREYEKRGGGYKGDKDQNQRDLEQWTDEEWQTREGEANAREEGGETSRYLPKKAWENMSEDEKRETDRRKREGSRRGAQYVENTEEAKQARREAHDGLPLNDYGGLNVEGVERKAKGLSDKEVEQVLSYEKRHENRETLVAKLERMLGNSS